MTLVSDEEIIDIWEYAKAYWERYDAEENAAFEASQEGGLRVVGKEARRRKPRHAADPRNSNNEGVSMKFVLECITPAHVGLFRWFDGGGTSQHIRDAKIFNSAEEALASERSPNCTWSLVPVEVTPPIPGEVRRLI